MKIVLFHNLYRSSLPSGENLTVAADAERLRERGHDVHLATKSSDDLVSRRALGKLTASFSTIHSFRGVRDGLSILENFGPDVVHFHNLYPLWSPALSAAIARTGTPRLQVLHNYRLGCLSANLFREGRVCTDCVGKRFAVSGVRHGCYNGRLASLPIAVSRATHWSTLLGADYYLAISETVRQRSIENGIDATRIDVKPNHVLPPPQESAEPGDSFLFVGRLEDDKGLRLLLESYTLYRRRGGYLNLRIAGTGPLEDLVKRAAGETCSITFLGKLNGQQVAEEMRESRAIVSPAIWEEPFGRTILEAWGYSRAVIVTNLGGPGDLVSDGGGILCNTTVSSLADALCTLQDREHAKVLGLEGRRQLVEKYSGHATVAAYESAWRAMNIDYPTGNE